MTTKYRFNLRKLINADRRKFAEEFGLNDFIPKVKDSRVYTFSSDNDINVQVAKMLHTYIKNGESIIVSIKNGGIFTITTAHNGKYIEFRSLYSKYLHNKLKYRPFKIIINRLKKETGYSLYNRNMDKILINNDLKSFNNALDIIKDTLILNGACINELGNEIRFEYLYDLNSKLYTKKG